MRKLFFIAVLALAAAAAFAQDAPKNNEIYGRAWFEYALNEDRLDQDPAVLGDFTFARLRFGMRNTLSDTLKTAVEFDPRTLEFRLAYADWTPLQGLTITAGKTSKLFAQTNGWIYGSRTYGVGAKYVVPGIGWGGLQVANDYDIQPTSSSKFAFPGTTPVNITSTVVGQTDIKINPWVAYKPDLGKDMSLEVGANAELNVSKMTASTPTGASVDGYALASFGGLSLASEFTYKNINDEVTANQDVTLFAQVTYNFGSMAPFAPTAYLVWDHLEKSTSDMTVFVELPWTIQKGLVFNPVVSYNFSGKNVNSGISGTNDWTVELRLDWAISAKF